MEDASARAQKTFLVPSNYQILVDYDSGTNPVYVGYGSKGLLTSDEGWFIMYITWDVNDNPTTIKSANDAEWDNRATTVVYS